MTNLGVISIGVKLPIIQKNLGIDKLCRQIKDSLNKASTELDRPFKDKDIICITESIVARAENNYMSVDEIADFIIDKYGKQNITLVHPIYSRNRFSLILKAIAKAAKECVKIYMPAFDEVGNPSDYNPYTGINIKEYYQEIVQEENKICIIEPDRFHRYSYTGKELIIYCGLHDYDEWETNLTDLAPGKYGLLGSNKATEETLKLFPSEESCAKICESLKDWFNKNLAIDVEVMIYGDGCFKDPVAGIWEFADPVVSPYYTSGLEGTPNEVKIKYIADNESIESVKKHISEKESNLIGKMISQGTTPRRYCDLIGSLADLTSGSGDKGTPVIWISNYFNNYLS